MNLLTRFFAREATTVETTACTGADGVLGELEAEAQREQRARAERIARERQQTEEYRARIEAEGAELRGRVLASLDELGDLVPRLMLACAHFATLADEVQTRGVGFSGGLLEDHFGVPPDFGARLSAAIKSCAPRTEWDFGHTGVLGNGAKAERPKLTTPTFRAPRFAGENAPPRGFSGVWDYARGRPVIDEAAPLTVLPL